MSLPQNASGSFNPFVASMGGITPQSLSALAALAANLQSQIASGTSPQQQPISTMNMSQNVLDASNVAQQLLNHQFGSHGAVPNPLQFFMQRHVTNSSSMPRAGDHARQHTELDILAGTLINDEKVCIDAFVTGRKQGLTPRRILEGLHGTNNHTAGSWKDYYLEHHDRIEDRISEATSVTLVSSPSAPLCQEPSRETGRVPPKNDHRNRTLSRSTMQRQHNISFSDSVDKGTSSRSSIHRDSPVNKPRSQPLQHAANSQTTEEQDAASSSETEISLPPSHSPTPPPDFLPDDEGKRSKRYTAEEERFFVRSIKWQLTCDPTTTRAQMAKTLANKASRHSFEGWKWMVRRERHLVDRLVQMAMGAEADEKYSDSTESESTEEAIDGGDNEDEEGSQEDPSTDEDIENMGEADSCVTDADLRVMARHVASHPAWEYMSRKDRWESFQSKHPQRSIKAWSGCYSRRQPVIDSLARKYKQRNARSRSKRIDTVHPEDNNASPPVSLKRKYQDYSDEDIRH